MTSAVSLVTLLGLVFASGCGDAASTAAASSTGPAATRVNGSSASQPAAAGAPTSTTIIAAGAVVEDQLPTEADFEEEADTQIDASNMETELSALAGEIAADK